MRVVQLVILSFVGLPILYGQTLFFRTYEEAGSANLDLPNCLIERTNGFIYMGDENGLWQFDGRQFQPISTTDSLQDVAVSALFEDSQQQLWIGYRNGAIYRSDGLLPPQAWEPEEGWPAAAITGFAVDFEGRLWWATYGEGVYGLKDGHVYQFGIDDGLPSEDIYTIVADQQGRILIGSDNGVCLIGWSGDDKFIRHFTKNDGLPDDIIYSLLPSPSGGCWVGGYEGGVSYLDIEHGIASPLPLEWPGGTIVDLLLCGSDDLWVATETEGIYRWNNQRQTWKKSSHEDWQSGSIHAAYQDSEANIWVLSREQIISSANTQFTFLPLSLPTPQSVALDDDDGLWIGTEAGLYFRGPDRQSFEQFSAAKLNIISLYFDPNGVLWIGTFGEGLFALRPGTDELFHYGEQDGLNNGNILSITGKDDQLWLATLGGVYQLSYHLTNDRPSLRQLRHLEGEDAPGTEFIYCAYIDSQNRVWFGTDGEGISMLSPAGEHLTYSARKNGTPIRSVYSIAEDGHGRIWASTESGDILYLENEQFALANFRPSNRKDAFVSLLNDEQGNLLLIHPNGIDRLDPEHLTIVHHHDAAGFNGFEPGLNAFSTTAGAAIHMVGLDRLVQYSPTTNTIRQHPKVVIDRVSVFLEPIVFQNTMHFGAKENNLAFHYSGIWYTDPSLLTYRYQLEGFDRTWINTGDQQVVYSNLPPGEYTFRVAASANEDFSQAIEDTYHFSIALPLWQRTWFILIAIAGFLGIAILILRQREKRLKREASLKKEKVQSQYEALKSQINPHFLFNSFNTLASLIEEKPSHAVSYIEKLADFYRGILQYRERDLIALEEELSMIQDYAYLLQERYGDNFQLQIDLERRDYAIVPFSLQMLVENAVKHNVISRRQPLNIRIYTQDDLTIIVENPKQLKMTKERSTGFGISSIRSRYAILTDQPIWIDDQPNLFRIGLPLLKPKQL